MKAFLKVLAAVALLAGCGRGNELTGDVRFPIGGAHALRTDAGQDLGTFLEVFLTEPDATCAELRSFVDAPEDAPLPRPFQQAVVLGWRDVGNASYPIANVMNTGSIVGSGALWYVGTYGGSAAVSRRIQVSGVSTAHTSGDFEVKTLESFDYYPFMEQGGYLDDAGNPHWPDGGAISSLTLSGSFDVDVCP